MKFTENKEEILVAFALTLKRTYDYHKLIDMTLEENISGTYVICRFQDCKIITVDVTDYNGAEMIKAIINYLEGMR